MKGTLRFPIRLKILVALLLVVTAVVSAITFTMANLFHQDKQAYIKDLASMVALSTAQESHALLTGYHDRLRIYDRIMANAALTTEAKQDLLQDFFDDFPELVAVSLYEEGAADVSAFNSEALRMAGLSKDDIRQHRGTHPIPVDTLRNGQVYLANESLSETLPCFTMALSTPHDDGRDLVVSAIIALDGLLELAARSGSFEVLVADGTGRLLAHPDVRQVGRKRSAALEHQVTEVPAEFRTGLTVEYVQNGIETIGGFANAGIGDVTVVAQIPASAAYLASRNLLGRLILVALLLLVVATLAGLFWARRITRPVERLSGAAREIGKGQFDVRIDVTSRDEIGALAGSFNEMSHELKDRESSLQAAQAQLIQSEKLAAFGQLGAGIAHEVKNPLAGILGCAQLSLRKVAADAPVRENLELIEKETKRCKSIIENLLRFARQEKAAFDQVDINSVVEDSIAIISHQMELSSVKIETSLSGDLPMLLGNANQIQQVLMNLMMNAQHAMEGAPGQVRVTTRLDAEHLDIVVSDSGPGIAPEHLDKLFEPFFTTKPGGKGTGLGLSVSYGIVKDHGGEILAESEPGEGASFTVRLPLRVQKDEVEPADAQAV